MVMTTIVNPDPILVGGTLFDIISANPNSIVFDASDIEYLVNNFTIDQLREELSRSYQHLDRETERRWQFFYVDFIKSCKLAVRYLKSIEPKPTETPSNNKFIDVEALKDTIDIVEIAERYTRLHKSGKSFGGLCPFHSEKQPSFMVYPQQQTWHCFGACNTGGDVISLIMKAENTDFKGAVAVLGGVR